MISADPASHSAVGSASGSAGDGEPGPLGPVPGGEPDAEVVTELLGRRPQGRYQIALRRDDGTPVVLRNAPLLYSGRPMPTRYWLIDRALNRAIGRLESTGAVDLVEATVDADELVACHNAYAAERDAEMPADHVGPKPYGGVGGTRVGVKCLHAHYAYFLVGGDDPVGRWVDEQLRRTDDHFDPAAPALVPGPSPRSGS